MEAMVEEVTGVKVVSMHHDISTASSEELIAFTLAEAPLSEAPADNVAKDFVGVSRQRRAVTTQCVSLHTRQVHPTGLEPVTFGSVDRCSIQLS